MSYCRWSSDRHQCDVYVYEGYEGYVCHIAGRKIVNLSEAPKDVGSILDFKEEDRHIWMENHRAWMKWLETEAIREDIGLEFDGETFSTDTATDMGNQLKMLQDMGYRVPNYVIEALWEEGKENGEQAEL